MSFSSHRRKVLDESNPLAHRASHARSCALHVSYKFRLEREVIIQEVENRCGVSLHSISSADEVLTALECLDALRKGEWQIEDTSAEF